MSTTVKAGWLKDSQGNKFAPKTLSSQVVSNDGVTLSDSLAQLEGELKSYADEKVSDITSGTTPVPKAEEADHATSADTATSATTAESATKATQDGNGKVIADTYETKTDSNAKLAEAKSYADTAAATVKNDLLNGAGESYDTLKELGELIDENTDALDALNTVATNKADKAHNHDDVYYTETEIDTIVANTKTYVDEQLSNKADADHTHTAITNDEIDAICGNTYQTVLQSIAAEGVSF